MKLLLYVLPLCVFAACSDAATIATAVTDSLPKMGAPVADKLTPSPVDGTWSGSFSQSAEDEALHKQAEDFLNKLNAPPEGSEEEYIEDYYITDGAEIPADLKRAFYREPLHGYYTLRAPNKLTLIIEGQDAAGNLVGKSVCAGNERAIRGKAIAIDGGFGAVLSEPGDHKNDGTFTVQFITDSRKLVGTWKPAKGGGEKALMGEKKAFAYDPAAGAIDGFRQAGGDWMAFKKNPSVDPLHSADLEKLTAPELAILRNLVFARHGYSFADAAIRNYFENSDWYMPVSINVKDKLTALEKKNSTLIKSYEKYANKAYDEFGR